MQFYKKALVFSKKSPISKIRAQNNIAGVYSQLSKYKEAISVYQNLITECTENDLQDDFYIASYNLGYMYFLEKKYNKALVYFKKCDSVASKTKNNTIDYLKSNFYQAKIYNALKQSDLAHKHSKIYLDNYEQYEAKINNETAEVNYKQGKNNLKAEMLSIEKEYKKDLLLNWVISIFCIFLLIGVAFLLIKNRRDKNITRKNIANLTIKVRENKMENQFYV